MCRPFKDFLFYFSIVRFLLFIWMTFFIISCGCIYGCLFVLSGVGLLFAKCWEDIFLASVFIKKRGQCLKNTLIACILLCVYVGGLYNNIRNKNGEKETKGKKLIDDAFRRHLKFFRSKSETKLLVRKMHLCFWG